MHYYYALLQVLCVYAVNKIHSYARSVPVGRLHIRQTASGQKLPQFLPQVHYYYYYYYYYYYTSTTTTITTTTTTTMRLRNKQNTHSQVHHFGRLHLRRTASHDQHRREVFWAHIFRACRIWSLHGVACPYGGNETVHQGMASHPQEHAQRGSSRSRLAPTSHNKGTNHHDEN